MSTHPNAQLWEIIQHRPDVIISSHITDTPSCMFEMIEKEKMLQKRAAKTLYSLLNNDVASNLKKAMDSFL